MYFELFKSKANNEWYWRLKAANHQTIATGGEGYKNKSDAAHGIELIKSTTAKTPVNTIE